MPESLAASSLLTTRRPYVVIVVLNWNGKPETLECLGSLSKLVYSNFSILVVDNGSTDGSVDAIRNQFPLVEVLETGRNLGYAGGNNVGIRRALELGAGFILVLNNDVVVAPTLVCALMEVAEAKRSSAIVGAYICYFNEPDKIWYAGGRWSTDLAALEHIGDGRRVDELPVEGAIETEYVCGCALLIPVNVIRTIGLMDERFFLTYEETDWCYRARRMGFGCYVAPRARLWHKISVSFGGDRSPLQEYFYARNALLWAERHLPRSEYLRLLKRRARELLRVEQDIPAKDRRIKRWYWTLRSVVRRTCGGHADPTDRAKLLGFRDYVLRRFGDCPAEVRELNLRSRRPASAALAEKVLP